MPALEIHVLGDTTIHWDARRGRGLRVEGPLSEGHLAAVARWGDVSALDGVWVRHRACLIVPGGVWAADPTVCGPDGHPYRLVPLDDVELALLAAVNDARTGADLARRCGCPDDRVRRLAARLTAFEVAAIQLRPEPLRRVDTGLRRVLGRRRPPNTRTSDQRDALGRTDLTTYHQQSITDGTTHFDDRETTFAHAFGRPHPAFDGLRYGTRLRQVLRERGLPVDGPVVECGCGTGELAAAWGPPREGTYRRFDLSPVLLRTQALAAPWSLGIEADLVDLPVASGTVPLLICNEVLADLEAVPVDAEDAVTRALRESLGLEALPTGYHNPGAWRALREASRVLAPGGTALFTEFGVVEGTVAEAEQLDHPEVGVHFGQLARAGVALGLEVRLERLDDLVQPRADATWLSRHSWRAVRSWMRSRGRWLPARAWTPQSLADALPESVDGLEFVPLTHEGPGPLMTRFHALTVRKPIAVGSAD